MSNTNTNTNKTNTNLTAEANAWLTELRNQYKFSDELFAQCVFHGDTKGALRSAKVTMEPLHYKDFTITLKKFGRAPVYILTGNNLVCEGYWFDVVSKLYKLTH